MKLDLIIAIWGALLSTILAINTFLQTKKEYRINLLIDCQEIISDGKEMINVFISNTWKRPVTLIELSWGLGSDKEFQTILYSYHLQDLIKLNESESFSISFDKIILLDNTKHIKDKELMFKKLFINVKISSGITISNSFNLDIHKYKIDINPKYDMYIATAKFLDRDLIANYNEHFELKMRYIHK